jgi:hypothetical protein
MASCGLCEGIGGRFRLVWALREESSGLGERLKPTYILTFSV